MLNTKKRVADIDSDGYQTAVAITCETLVSRNRIDLLYKKRRQGDTSSQTIDLLGTISDRYKSGELLLTLKISLSPKTPRIITYWRAYQPIEIRPKNGRVYFRKDS